MGMVITLAVMLLAVGYAVLALHSETLGCDGHRGGRVGGAAAGVPVCHYPSVLPGMDRPLMAIYALLIAIGFIAQYRLGSAMAFKAAAVVRHRHGGHGAGPGADPQL